MAERQDVSGGSAAPMCANGCGFFGSAATKNLCSKCYKDHLINNAAAPVAEKKVEVVMAAAHMMPEQSTGHVPDAAAAVVATATPVAQAPAEEENGGPVETQNQDASAAVECANACSFFGSAATNNLCSGCYRDFLKNAHAAQISAAAATSSAAAPAAPDRCASCRKKVGLLGFPCRCGGTFCSLHRYAEKHACDFDFKAAGREKIAKNNPLVVAAKIDKI